MRRRPLICHWRNPVSETLRREAFSISASEGTVLIEAPGVAATLDIDAASFLADELLAACGVARLQQRRTLGQAPNSGPSSSG